MYTEVLDIDSFKGCRLITFSGMWMSLVSHIPLSDVLLQIYFKLIESNAMNFVRSESQL